MLKLYTHAQFSFLEQWVTDADLLLQFSGTEFIYPITKEQISIYTAAHPERRFYLGYTTDLTPFAFGEIIPQESGVPRIARILVGDPALRGRGLGRHFIKLLLNECKLRFGSNQAELCVWDENYPAINCYKSAGFKYIDEKYRVLSHENRSYNIHKMTINF